jgi:hypothetical protein
MGDGARLAIAILMLFLAMVAFFFAFHPGGVDFTTVGATDASKGNPSDVLKWLFLQFDTATTGGTSGAAAVPNTSVPSTNLTNVPGTNVGP